LLTSWLHSRRASAPEKPLRDELLSIERLEERALALAARFTIDPDPRRRARDTYPRFEDNVRLLRDAYRTLADDVRNGRHVVFAGDWLLDNFHLVAAEISDIRRNLPRAYSRTLPTLASREHAGHARIYAIAVELIRHSDSRLDRQQLIQFLNSYQRVAPLTIGELWAWPSMLKLALIENLRRLAEELLAARAARLAADSYVATVDEAGGAGMLPPDSDPAFIVQLLHRLREYGLRLSALRSALDDTLAARNTTPEDTVRVEHQRQGVALVSVANAITSLRLCATLDWPSSRWRSRAVKASCVSRSKPSKAPGRPRPTGRRPIARRTSAITSSIAAAPSSKPTSRIGPEWQRGCGGSSRAMRHSSISARFRSSLRS
jgi:cyclic beta-1,2-glucan glucanotransferase